MNKTTINPQKTAALYSFAENKTYLIDIDLNTDLNSDDFDWESVLLFPLEESGQQVNISCGVAWGGLGF